MKVFASHRLPGNGLETLAQHCDLRVWPREEPVPNAELIHSLSDCDGFICLLTNRVNRDLLTHCPRLRFVSSMSVGVDHVDVPALTARGIPLGNTPGVLVDTTAELALALILAAARRIPEADRFVRAGNWRPELPWRPDMMVGKDLAGATLGLVGLGAIGQAVAHRAQAFGMRVIAWNRTAKDVAGVRNVSLSELLETSDVVSVHVALTEATRNLIDANAIAAMKPGAILVNTARGGIVDEAALADALKDQRLFSAGVDVFETEPVEMDSPLLALENVVVAPHIGSATERTRARMADLAVANALAALEGKPMPHCVNPEVYSA
ncbi:MAG: D-glycerate dehydrogenase [Pseudomonadota bacterium]